VTGDGIVLPGAVGEYREQRPAGPLEPHFQCVWSNSVTADARGRMAIVPDGCVDLTWVDGELNVAGPDVAVYVAAIAPGSTVIGVRFRPGAATSWLGLPMSEIVGGRIALRELWGPRADEISRRIGDAPSTAERMRALEAALAQLAADREAPAPDMGFVFHALKTESAGPGLSVILDRLDVSPRTLRRRCVEAFGYGPRPSTASSASSAFSGWCAGLAFEVGYADQADLTREVRRLTSLSPSAILAQLRV